MFIQVSLNAVIAEVRCLLRADSQENLPIPVEPITEEDSKVAQVIISVYLASLLHALLGIWNRHIPVHPQSSG